MDPEHLENRRKVFLRGWQMFLNGTYRDAKDSGISWVALGAAYAEILGDISLNQRKLIYRLLLSQFLQSNNIKHWTDAERHAVLKSL